MRRSLASLALAILVALPVVAPITAAEPAPIGSAPIAARSLAAAMKDFHPRSSHATACGVAHKLAHRARVALSGLPSGHAGGGPERPAAGSARPAAATDSDRKRQEADSGGT